jgi:hypothetical protein
LVAAGGVFNELVLSAETGVSPGVSPNRPRWSPDPAWGPPLEITG